MTTQIAPAGTPGSELAIATETGAPTSQLNPLSLLARRWPLLAVGLAVGAVIGYFNYVKAPAVYESAGQVLVIKKRTELVKDGDIRVGAVEDYVSTQVTLLKSEKIGLAAAREARKLGIPNLPTDDHSLAGMIRSGLAVARDKETSQAGFRGGNGVLNLSYRGSDPALCRQFLEAVIKAHQAELYAIYDKQSQEKIAQLNTMIDALSGKRQSVHEEQIRLKTEVRTFTDEAVAVISTRVSAGRDQKRALKGELAEYTEQLDTISKVGDNPRDRQLVLAQFTAQFRSPTAGLPGTGTGVPADPIRSLEAEKRRLIAAKGLGKDHPSIVAIDAEIAVIREGMSRNDAADPNAPELDELGAYGKFVEQKKRTAERHLREVNDQLERDERVLKEAGGRQDRIDEITAQIAQLDVEIKKHEAEKLSTNATQGAGGYSTETITPPGSGYKISPVFTRSLMMGLALGALLGFGMMVLAERSDRSFRSPAEIRQRLGLPVVGHIPSISSHSSPEAKVGANLEPTLVAALRPKSSEAEAYRGLRTQLYFSTQGRGHQVIQVTSPVPGDGKSTLAANLALSVAQSGKRTVLIDCDFRKPRVHKLFGVPAPETGLAGVVAGVVPLASELVPSGVANLDLLACGPRPANPAELLTSPQFQQVLSELRTIYDFVIVDSPPLLAVTDPAVVAPRVDGVLLVFRMTKKARPMAERACEQLAAVGANVLGVVVNGSQSAARGSYGYGYSYGSAYGYGYGYKYSDYQYTDHYTDKSDV
jgi:capsular exopolysaccharide synthesis family protein